MHSESFSRFRMKFGSTGREYLDGFQADDFDGLTEQIKPRSPAYVQFAQRMKSADSRIGRAALAELSGG